LFNGLNLRGNVEAIKGSIRVGRKDAKIVVITPIAKDNKNILFNLN